jgi:hypothetical protein
MQPPTIEGIELEEAVAALMDLAAEAVDLEIRAPRSAADLLRMGAECRRRGLEFVIQRDAEFRVTSVLKIRASSMVEFRARARAATVTSGPLSEVIRASVDLVSRQTQYQFVTMEELQGLLERESYSSRLRIGVPQSWLPGVPALPPSCPHR